jgi:hypothetical protein
MEIPGHHLCNHHGEKAVGSGRTAAGLPDGFFINQRKSNREWMN